MAIGLREIINKINPFISASIAGKEDKSAKNANNGYVGLTGFLIDIKNSVGAALSYFQSNSTATRTFSLPDKSGTFAFLDDLEKKEYSLDITNFNNIDLTGKEDGDIFLLSSINTQENITGFTNFPDKKIIEFRPQGNLDLYFYSGYTNNSIILEVNPLLLKGINHDWGTFELENNLIKKTEVGQYNVLFNITGLTNYNDFTGTTLSNGSFTNITYSAITNGISTSSLTINTLFFITDRNIWVNSLSTYQVATNGYLLATVPDYQNINSNPNYLGIFSSYASVSAGTIYTYNNLNYINNTGFFNSLLTPNLDNVNFSALSLSDNSYLKEINLIKYDLLNDFITERSDLRNNILSTTIDSGYNFNYFQWGNNNCINNFSSNSNIHNENNTGITKNCFFIDSYVGITGSTLSATTIKNSNINLNSNLLSFCEISYINTNIPSGYSAYSNTINSNFSDFEYNINLNDPTIFDNSTHILSLPYNFVGIYNLINDSSTIYQINNINPSFKTEFRPDTNSFTTFIPTSITVANSNEIISETSSPITINGALYEKISFVKRNGIHGVFQQEIFNYN